MNSDASLSLRWRHTRSDDRVTHGRWRVPKLIEKLRYFSANFQVFVVEVSCLLASRPSSAFDNDCSIGQFTAKRFVRLLVKGFKVHFVQSKWFSVSARIPVKFVG